MEAWLLAAGFASAVAGGLVQGFTGFGAGIVMMLALPFAFAVSEAAGITGVVSLVLTLSMTWRYRDHVNPRAIVGPAVLYIAASWVSILVAQQADQDVMKGVLGVFLVALAAYFLSGAGDGFRPEGAVALLCIVISGVCDGLFGIGGPLMVVYYLTRTDGVEEYLGTIQPFFAVTLAAATVVRVANGVLVLDDIPLALLCGAGVLIGSAVASRLLSRTDPALVRKATYAVIGIAGAINVAEVLL